MNEVKEYLYTIANNYEIKKEDLKTCWQCKKELNSKDYKDIPSPLCWDCEYKRYL